MSGLFKKNKTPVPTPEQVALDQALARVTDTCTRLDDLKEVYNFQLRSLTNPPTVERFSEAVTLPPPPLVPREEEAPVTPRIPNAGRYYVDHVANDLGVTKRPPIPRPRQKSPPKVSPPRKPSGRFYIEVKAETLEALAQAKEKIGFVGRIVDSGRGTAADPSVAWVEVATQDEMTTLIDKLKKIDIREIVEKVIEVAPGEGRIQARNLELFAK